MINITNARARTLYQINMDRQMMVLGNSYVRQIRPILNQQFSDVADLIEQSVMDASDHVVDRDYRLFVSSLEKYYRRVAVVFGDKTFKVIDKTKKSFQLKGPLDEFWSTLNQWMGTQAADKITKIQKTTKRTIAGIIQMGMNEGESHREIAKRIRKTGLIINPRRALVIARTETHTAANTSVDAAVKSTRIVMEPEWVATLDERVRIAHAKANGQRIEEGGSFDVGGEKLKYPGDSKGSAGNVIFCRCVVIYHTKKVGKEG